MIINAILAITAVFVSLIVHEIAHGYVALRLGDDTAKNQGRLTFNPLHHIDLFGTIILPLLLYFSKIGFVFGWAKPVPIDYSKIKGSKKNLIWVASAGILANLALAVISALLLKFLLWLPHSFVGSVLAMFCFQMIFINLILAVFNLLPIPPLDGSKILLSWTENRWIQKYMRLEEYGLALVVFLMFILPALLLAFDVKFNPLVSVVKSVTNWLMKFIVQGI